MEKANIVQSKMELTGKINKYCINHASIVFTENCNLNCSYCYESEKKRHLYMSKETAEKVIDFLVNNAVHSGEKQIFLMLFGGEPTLNIEVMDYTWDYALKKTQENGISLRATLITNGSVYNQAVEDFIIKAYTTCSRFKIQLSIDGDKETQDTNRPFLDGSGSSDVVEENIRKLKEAMREHNISENGVYVHGCISKQSLPRLKHAYDYVRDVLKINDFSIFPVKEENWDKNDYKLYESQLRLIGKRIIEDCEKEDTAKYFMGFDSFKERSAKQTLPCMVGTGFCCISTEGDIYPCHRYMFGFRENSKIGSVFEPDNLKREKFMHYDMSNLHGKSRCVECENDNCKICVASNDLHNENMFLGFPKCCNMTEKETMVKKEVKQELIKLGLLENVDKQKEINVIEAMYTTLETLDERVSNNADTTLILLDLVQKIYERVENLEKGDK